MLSFVHNRRHGSFLSSTSDSLLDFTTSAPIPIHKYVCFFSLIVLFLLLLGFVDVEIELFVNCVVEFVSIDCGGLDSYNDPVNRLQWESDKDLIRFGKSVKVTDDPSTRFNNSKPYEWRRDFTSDSGSVTTGKYCYKLGTEEHRRYLIRATFKYGSLEDQETYPKFKIYLDATLWATVVIEDGARVYVKEIIVRASSTSVDVCLCCATTGVPFISTLELRPLNVSMYATDFEDSFFLKVAARVNFGALTKDVIRYVLSIFLPFISSALY